MPTVIREDTLDEFPWETIETTTDDAGALVQRLTRFDNGVVRDQLFENGVRTSTTQVDASPDGSAVPWQSIVTEFDAGGQVSRRVTTFDNGVVRDELFEGGTRTSTVQFDQSPDGSAAPWQSIRTDFDADGQISQRITGFDNGTSKIEAFEAGERASILQLDESFDGSAAPWQSIRTDFDAEGKVEQRLTSFDNGVIRDEMFNGGVRSVTTQTDTSVDGFAKPWSETFTRYDENGDLDVRAVTFDNGIVKADKFGETGREASIFIDQSPDGSAAPWSQISVLYDDNGDVQSRLQIMDNADRFVFEFEGGAKVSKAEFDGDGSDPWLFEVTQFDDQGAVQEVVTYDSRDELPLELVQLFDFDPGV